MKFNNIEFAGQRVEGGITYTIAAGALEGDAVTLTTTATAGRGSAGNPLLGKLVKIEGDARGTVNSHGVIIMRAGAGLAVGQQTLTVDGAGAVTMAAGGRQALVIGIADGMAVIDLP